MTRRTSGTEEIVVMAEDYKSKCIFVFDIYEVDDVILTGVL